jgi:hypothetical protein
MAAGSTDRCNTFCELLSWGRIEQGLSRSFFSCLAIALSLVWLCRDRSVPRGRYWRSNLLVFSFDPRCQGQRGSQKQGRPHARPWSQRLDGPGESERPAFADPGCTPRPGGSSSARSPTDSGRYCLAGDVEQARSGRRGRRSKDWQHLPGLLNARVSQTRRQMSHYR